MDSEAVQLLAEASQALGSLQGLVQSLPRLQILVRPFMRREAELSSRIEGTYANQEELVLFELDRQTAADKPDGDRWQNERKRLVTRGVVRNGASW